MKEKGYLRIVKALSLAVILMFTLYFQGCNSNHTDKENKTDIIKSSGEIVETKLTDNEKQLVQGLEIDKYFIFDVNITDKNINSLEVWADYYEKGKLNNKVFGMGTDINQPKEKNSRIIISNQKFKPDKPEEKWTVSIYSNGSGGKGSVIVNRNEEAKSWGWSSIVKESIVTDKEIVLAIIAGNQENNMRTFSVDNFNNSDEKMKNETIKEILKNDYVYIIKCKFK
ncbi:MAG: hypothetical protein E7211_12490 [Clostridium lundense]|nr:hypothetical protein [Clostridium lundense]